MVNAVHVFSSSLQLFYTFISSTETEGLIVLWTQKFLSSNLLICSVFKHLSHNFNNFLIAAITESLIRALFDPA